MLFALSMADTESNASIHLTDAESKLHGPLATYWERDSAPAPQDNGQLKVALRAKLSETFLRQDFAVLWKVRTEKRTVNRS
jgi:hypothetical protein